MLRTLAAVPEPPDGRESNPMARAQRVAAAPAELRTALVHAFQRRGGTVVLVPPGPLSSLVAGYRERSGVEAVAAPARVSRFSKLRARKSATATASAGDSGALER